MSKFNLLELLDYIEPGATSYSEWTEIGMALKSEGYTASDWDTWSQKDPQRYRPGEVYSKWETFLDVGITGATITQMAKDNGWQSRTERRDTGALDWNSTISDELRIIDDAWIENKEVHEPNIWNPKDQIIRYINALFDSNDYVGYVTETWESGDGKALPGKGVYSKSAGQIIEELNKYDDIGFAIGDYNPLVGAWIRFNPLDGQGVKNDNVTDFRYALVESDTTDIERQNAILRELELPIAMLVHSGGKSLHAIVRIDANSIQQYKERVNHLYDVCLKNGLEVDRQNKNPSRLSRLPGIERNGNKQFIVDANIGKATYDEWVEWVEEVNDELPDPESLADVWDNMPDKAPELIKGVLRQGHKMLFAGPSKAGKSFALIELAIAIAEGSKWMGWDCVKGRVMYVNLELDDASGFHRFKDVYEAMGLPPNNLNNIDIWNLRGRTAPMDKLAPKLIRRAEKRGYIAVIIDPIYKVLTGDENSAADMAHFTNQFDKIATSLKTAVIYAHHHSKGTQGGKSSMDRASGSGVFARDPDAILDLIELEVTEGIKNQQADEAACQVYIDYFRKYQPEYMNNFIGRDDMMSITQLHNHAKQKMAERIQQISIDTLVAGDKAKKKSAWRIEGTLREFAKFDARNMWFEYPVHRIDDSGVLNKAAPEGDGPAWKKAVKGKEDNSKNRKNDRLEALEEGFNSVAEDGKADILEVAESIGKSDRTVRSYVKQHKKFTIQDGYIVENEENENN